MSRGGAAKRKADGRLAAAAEDDHLNPPASVADVVEEIMYRNFTDLKRSIDAMAGRIDVMESTQAKLVVYVRDGLRWCDTPLVHGLLSRNLQVS
jgi:hypothetical protein